MAGFARLRKRFILAFTLRIDITINRCPREPEYVRRVSPSVAGFRRSSLTEPAMGQKIAGSDFSTH